MLSMADEWLVTLSMSGATALVAAAATDIWQEIRTGFCKLFGHGDPGRESLVERRLDEIVSKTEQADESAQDEVREAQVSVWQTRLADLLEEQPGRANELRSLIDRVEAFLPQGEGAQTMGTGPITTTNTGGINVANTGAMRDVNLDGAPSRSAE